MESFLAWIVDQLGGILASNVVSTIAIFSALWAKRRFFRKRLSSDVEKAYILLRHVCEPDTLNPANPGNPAHMKSEARDFVNPLGTRLRKAGFDPPAKCGTDDASLQQWFEFLENARILN